MGRSQCTENQMEPVRLTLHAGGRSEVYQPHEGEDFGYVITGNVRIHYAGQNQTVHAGESFYFKAGKSIIWKTPVQRCRHHLGYYPTKFLRGQTYE